MYPRSKSVLKNTLPRLIALYFSTLELRIEAMKYESCSFVVTSHFLKNARWLLVVIFFWRDWYSIMNHDDWYFLSKRQIWTFSAASILKILVTVLQTPVITINLAWARTTLIPLLFHFSDTTTFTTKRIKRVSWWRLLPATASYWIFNIYISICVYKHATSRRPASISEIMICHPKMITQRPNYCVFVVH